jgi:hypothetical protein
MFTRKATNAGLGYAPVSVCRFATLISSHSEDGGLSQVEQVTEILHGLLRRALWRLNIHGHQRTLASFHTEVKQLPIRPQALVSIAEKHLRRRLKPVACGISEQIQDSTLLPLQFQLPIATEFLCLISPSLRVSLPRIWPTTCRPWLRCIFSNGTAAVLVGTCHECLTPWLRWRFLAWIVYQSKNRRRRP